MMTEPVVYIPERLLTALLMTVAQYNTLPAFARRTEGGKRYVKFECEWREVAFVKECGK